jgi:hypothetical protein
MMMLSLLIRSSARMGDRHTARSLSSVASTPVEKMETDRRYQPTVDVPDSLLHQDDFTSAYSIRGKFREGRAAYLDHSATTPLDPRVLDAMAPFMVSIHEMQTKLCC